MKQGYFEDFSVGESFRTGGVTLTEAGIIDYAMRYDPQPIHTDRIAAADSIYGGIIASGWHVGGVAFRMFIQAGIIAGGSMGSPGVDEVRWHAPVRPGDTVHMVATVLETRPSASRDDRGYVTMQYQVYNQRDENVMSWKGVQIIGRRGAAAEA
jgi:acyl dehydratase